MDEKISVIVPIYKVEAYLKKCVESICHQTYQNLEIILVDDGSPDHCGEMCDELAAGDSRIIVLHKENGGVSSARNAGLEVATGAYISFVDSDDFVAENFLEVLYNLCKKYDCKLAQCGYSRNQAEGKIKPVPIVQEKVYKSWQSYLLGNDYAVAVWNKLYARELFADIRFPQGKKYEDQFTTYKLVYQQEIIVVTNEKLYAYVQRQGSIMNSKVTLHNLDAVEVLEEQLQFYRLLNEQLLFEDTQKWCCYSILSCICGLKRDVEDCKAELTELHRKYKAYSAGVLRDSSTPFLQKMMIVIGKIFPWIFNITHSLAMRLKLCRSES